MFITAENILSHMTKVKKSEYIRISKTVVRKLYDANCFGKGSLYIHALQEAIPPEEKGKVEPVVEALIKQRICVKKKKERGWKYFLNMDRLDKIKEIIR
jgi:hypothetical protein